MNIQSWLLLIVILAIVSYIVYTRFISNTSGECVDCPGCEANNKHSCCS